MRYGKSASAPPVGSDFTHMLSFQAFNPASFAAQQAQERGVQKKYGYVQQS